MTETLLRLVPAVPTFVPPQARTEAARQALQMMLPAKATSATLGRHVFFVDSGRALRSIRCPLCDGDIALPRWKELLEAAAARQFAQLDAVVPCCTGRVALPDLAFDAPCAFARFMLESRNPARPALTDDERRMLERLLGTPLKVIVAQL